MIRVLVVDDIASNRIILGELLSCLGMSFKLVINGKLALEELRINRYDVVLMDIEMPVMNGIETTLAIKQDKKLKDIPVIALTAHNPRDFIDGIAKAKFDNLITKPYNIENIEKSIHSAIADRRNPDK